MRLRQERNCLLFRSVISNSALNKRPASCLGELEILNESPLMPVRMEIPLLLTVPNGVRMEGEMPDLLTLKPNPPNSLTRREYQNPIFDSLPDCQYLLIGVK